MIGRAAGIVFVVAAVAYAVGVPMTSAVLAVIWIGGLIGIYLITT